MTGADTSPSGDRLALLTYSELWIFERPIGHEDWLAGRASRLELSLIETRTVEAVTWRDAKTLLIANEQRDLFEVDVEAFEPIDD